MSLVPNDDAMATDTPQPLIKEEEATRESSSESSPRAKTPANGTNSPAPHIQQTYAAPLWQNPWEQIQASSRSNDPNIRALEGPLMSQMNKEVAAMDHTVHNDPIATIILEAKVKDEIQLQYLLLATILTVDGRQHDKSYFAILTARVGRYKHRLDRWRWEKIYKSTNDVEGSRLVYQPRVGEIPIDHHRRVLYCSMDAWLDKTDEYYRNLAGGWTKCKYVTEKVLEVLLLWTDELWEERAELERVYCEFEGNPPAFYQSNWAGPLKEGE